MIEPDLLGRLVFAIAMIAVGLGVIMPSYIRRRMRFRMQTTGGNAK